LKKFVVMRFISAIAAALFVGFVFAPWLLVPGAGLAQSHLPFEKLAGQWIGNGTIDLSDGTHEPIKCRASYDVLDQLRSLQLNIRCASDSYQFNLLANAKYSAGAISGSWSESTRNVAGSISGKAAGNRFEVTAKSSAFTASLKLTTHGDRQSVLIQSKEAQTALTGVSITLVRGG
jgi:hypothetical protein